MRALALAAWCAASVGVAVAQPSPAPAPAPAPAPKPGPPGRDDIERDRGPGPHTRIDRIELAEPSAPAPRAVVEAIRRALTRRLPALHACYARELKRDPELTGRLGVTFEITKRGAPYAVTTPADLDTVGVPRYARCVRRVIGRTAFAADHPATVTAGLAVTPR
ncbi:MAG: AgmX/PglI C-terminal domain-containing protein [Kofleriaceae bacterium]